MFIFGPHGSRNFRLTDLILERLSISAPPGRHFEGILVERGGTNWLVLFLPYGAPIRRRRQDLQEARHERRSGPVGH
jgi:hypothetical protein